MRTEEEIVYNILETVTAGHTGSDNRLNERLIRSFLREYRADSIRKNYKDGHTLSETMFQDVKIDFQKSERKPATNQVSQIVQPIELKGNEYQFQIPKLINLDFNYGIYFRLNDHAIPVYDKYAYDLNKEDVYSSNSAMVGIQGYQSAKLYVPASDRPINNMLRSFISTSFAGPSKSFSGYVHAVLADPEDGVDYDWTRTPYPFPEERLPELIYSILARKFNIILQVKPDEVVNARKDEILYHENHNLSNG